MLEPAVALTDLAISVECVALAWLLRSGETGAARRWFVAFFGAVGAGALLGGLEHGFVADKSSWAETALWVPTLLALGVAGLAAWGVGASLALAPRPARVVVACAGALFGAYALGVVLGERRFGVAIAYYLPGVLFLAAAFWVRLRRTGERRWRAGLWGLGLTLASAVIQQAQIGIHPRYFDHNALYHLVQAVALALLFRVAGARATR